MPRAHDFKLEKGALGSSGLVASLRNLWQRIEAFAQSRPRTFGFLACALVLAYRCHGRLAHPSLWAEDGTVFFVRALHYGAAALWQGYAGYLHLVPQLAYLLMTRVVPLLHVPYVAEASSILVYAAVASTFSSRAYEELLPGALRRQLVCVTLCFVLGLPEVLGNYANLHWVLYLFVWLLAIRPLSASHHGWETVVAVLTAFSAGECLVLVPLFAWRALVARRQGQRQAMVQSAVILVAITAAVALNLYLSQNEPHEAPGDLGAFAHAVGCTAVRSAAVEPWYGLLAPFDLQHTLPQLVLVGAGAALVISLMASLWRRGASKRLVVAGWAVAFGVPLLTIYVRPSSLSWFDACIPSPTWQSARYAFMMAPSSLLLWAVGLGSLRQWRGWVLVLFLASYASRWGQLAPIHAFDGSSRWRPFAEKVEVLRRDCSGKLSVTLDPPPMGAWYDPGEDQRCQRRPGGGYEIRTRDP